MYYSTFTTDDFDILWYVTYLISLSYSKSAHALRVMAILITSYRTRDYSILAHTTYRYIVQQLIYVKLPCMHVFACTQLKRLQLDQTKEIYINRHLTHGILRFSIISFPSFITCSIFAMCRTIFLCISLANTVFKTVILLSP